MGSQNSIPEVNKDMDNSNSSSGMSQEKKDYIKEERRKLYGDLLLKVVWERYKLLPQISVLAATLLIVATFNEKVIPLTNFVRLLIILFLTVIPICLFGYLFALKEAENKGKEGLKGIFGQKLSKGKEFFIAYLPWYMAGFITILIIFLIVLIIQGFTYNQILILFSF